MTPYDPQTHHRRSIRLKGYDYSQPGAYFITLVAYHRECLFGAVIDGEMQCSPLGKIVQEEWLRSIGIRKEIAIHDDEFIVMPNHHHGIVWIIGDVGADGVRPDDSIRPDYGVHPGDGVLLNTGAQRYQGASLAPLRRKPRSLSSFVAGFKASVTSRAGHELNLTGIWQRNYYDHILRDNQDFLNIWEYIDTNPQRWQEDQLHPCMLSNLSDQE